MATNNSPNMASLDLVMWRPTQEKPDRPRIVQKGMGFTVLDSCKVFFDLEFEGDVAIFPITWKSGKDSVVEVRRYKTQPSTSTSVSQEAFEFKTTATTEMQSESMLSVGLVMWRPTQEKPDSLGTLEDDHGALRPLAHKGGIAFETCDANFHLKPVEEGCDIRLWEKKREYTFDAALKQKQAAAVGRAVAPRTLDLTLKITAPDPASA